VQVALADLPQGHEHAGRPEMIPKGRDGDLTALEEGGQQAPHRGQGRAHDGQPPADPAHGRGQGDGVFDVARADRVGGRLDARGVLGAGGHVLQVRQGAPHARGVEVRQQADGRAGVRAVEARHPGGGGDLAQIGPVALQPAPPGADRAHLQPCLLPGFGLNVLLEGQLRGIAQLHLWARCGGYRGGPLLSSPPPGSPRGATDLLTAYSETPASRSPTPSQVIRRCLSPGVSRRGSRPRAGTNTCCLPRFFVTALS